MGIIVVSFPSFQSACQQELDEVLKEISKMTSEDNRGPLENLYELKFPNCDKDGLYNLKQVSHGNWMYMKEADLRNMIVLLIVGLTRWGWISSQDSASVMIPLLRSLFTDITYIQQFHHVWCIC